MRIFPLIFKNFWYPIFDKLHQWFPWIGEPRFVRAFNGWAAVTWLFLLIPSVVWWQKSLLWVIIMSAWANFASHYTAWVAARSDVTAHEAKAEIEAKTADVDISTDKADVDVEH